MKKVICWLLLALLLVQLTPAAFAEDFRAGGICTTEEQVIQEIRDQLKAREATFSVKYRTDTKIDDIGSFRTRVLNYAMLHTGKPTEGDYLKNQIGSRSWSSSGPDTSGGGYTCTLTYHISYYTTLAQEQELDAKISAVLAELKLDGKSDFEKFYAIYDYICDHVVYDYANLNDSDYKLKFTAYAALINGTAVCQGYSNLLYRMLLECGIDCRYISGNATNSSGTNGAHAWNIVCLDDFYYNVDATWDTAYKQAGRAYKYFLRCNANFTDHVRNADFDYPDFHDAYPMGPTDYPRFSDVPAGAYYREAVDWAVGEGITSGTSKTTFGPNEPCSRAQVVTFLWRCNGSITMSGYNPFTDVKTTDYYYSPVLWAMAHNITQGTSKTTFSPNAPCTRAQVVTFLWRAVGNPAATGNNPFKDVKQTDYYYEPVLWAVANGVTQGTSATTFGPAQTCTRAQVVTFLHRVLG